MFTALALACDSSRFNSKLTVIHSRTCSSSSSLQLCLQVGIARASQKLFSAAALTVEIRDNNLSYQFLLSPPNNQTAGGKVMQPTFSSLQVKQLMMLLLATAQRRIISSRRLMSDAFQPQIMLVLGALVPALRMTLANNGALYPVLGLASCVALVYMSFGDLALDLSTHAREPEMSFVGRNGTRFTMDGKAFYVNGWNSYWLMDQAVEEISRPRVKAMFQAGAKMGLTVCRTWAFNDGGYNALQPSLGHFDEHVFQALDRVIVEAKRHGIRLLLSLANNLEAYGGKTQYVKWAWEEGIGLSSSNDSFFFDPSIRSYFKTYLKVTSFFREIIHLKHFKMWVS
ncbi:Cellulase (glycosyl hydrolase family 5) [Musa troglodytarum]|uniref:mannan endo-1,4-beta-mannosidase n=1 Tax=Musa troglodytarum TaxID=320322 RepID=A0A9E7F7G9_9LILI|nr:Cellulase (glycosyl hydrolase family 5) [Musa troglodytarum]URD91331.1 Cellulase (glycosyl hydrolase family 5) [Musa troglodytarum]